MARIQRLDASVVNKIAAGEVIERPANVVKELLENSIDALSTHIEVDIGDGGSELIKITDDGEGIHPDDMVLAVTSHATSKIRNADDLFHIQTMGFRGEALASIAEVSHFRLRSRQRDSLTGNELLVDCGSLHEIMPCGAPPGTSIEIRNLFANTPVRRKFLKTKSTEFGHITEHFTRIALANPRLHLVLRHNGRKVFDLPPSDKLIDRARLFFGNSLADQLIWVESESQGLKIWGYVAHPSQNKPSRKWQYLFLNGRWFQDRAIQHALTEAYRGLLMVGRQPICFLFFDMSPSLVDVNVHPTKIEVRFVDSQQIYRQLLSMLRSKFLTMELDSELKIAPKPGTSKPAAGDEDDDGDSPVNELQTELSDWVDRQVTQAVSTDDLDEAPPPVTTWSIASERSRSVDHSFDRTARSTSPGGLAVRELPFTRSAASAGVATTTSAELPETEEEAAALFQRRERLPHETLPSDADDDSTGDLTDEELAARSVDPDEQRWQQDALQSAVAASSSRLERAAQRLGSAPANADAGGHVSSGRQSGVRAMQIMDCYILTETDKGLQIIDQHALHERIMYEYLRPRVLNGTVESQHMLIPETAELTAREVAMLLDHQELLSQFGFGVEEFGANTVIINRHPVMIRHGNLSRLMRDIAEQLETIESQPTRRDMLDAMLHMMSCKAAIKSGQRLTPEEIDSLLAQRHLVDDAHHCPHGRPTALTLSQQELDRQFGRLG